MNSRNIPLKRIFFLFFCAASETDFDILCFACLSIVHQPVPECLGWTCKHTHTHLHFTLIFSLKLHCGCKCAKHLEAVCQVCGKFVPCEENSYRRVSVSPRAERKCVSLKIGDPITWGMYQTRWSIISNLNQFNSQTVTLRNPAIFYLILVCFLNTRILNYISDSA